MIRTFTAYTAQDALAMVQRELGSNAVVLHTRNLKRGGLFGIGARAVVEITAADGRRLAQERRKEAERSPRAEALRKAREAGPTPRQDAELSQPMAGDLIRRTYQAARAQFNGPDGFCLAPGNPGDPDAVEVTRREVPNVVAVAPPPSRDDASLSRELAAVKHLVQQVARHQELTKLAETLPGVPDALVEHYANLIEQEVATDLAREMVASLDPEASDGDGHRVALLDALARQIPADPDGATFKPTADGRPRTVALVGPTGVGKTTTVAKLAANYLLKENKKVGLITADTYRIAAVEQLRTYAGIIGLPLEVVSGPEELQRAIHRLADRDVILIDTAGRSQRDAGRLDELSKLLQVAQPHETHLVLAATASQKVLFEVVERFEQIATDRLIFTKLDEAVACGVLLNVARRVGKPLSYITTGQEVPHQIEPGNPRRLAELILGKEVVAS